MTKRYFLWLFIGATLLTLTACPESRERPFGVVRLGFLDEFLVPERLLEDFDLLIRYDQQGLSAMSTLCTYDSSQLVMSREGQAAEFYSTYTSSRYAYDGQVISGPARSALPYYELFIDQGRPRGPQDTLYARIGIHVSKDWRLKIPAELMP